MSKNSYTTKEEVNEMMDMLSTAELAANNKTIKTKKTPAKIALNIFLVSIIVLLIFLLINILVTKAKGEIPSILGYQILRIETGSMEPTLPVGSIILSKAPENPSSIKPNAIITFDYPDGKIVTHRIIDVKKENNKTYYQTKGDNPINGVDPQLTSEDKVHAVYIRKIF